MKNELVCQTKCVEVIEAFGGHAFKSNNRFKAGILDVHYTLNGVSGFIEWKFDRYLKEGMIEVHATPKQQQFARRERDAGGLVIGLYFLQHKKERNWWAIVEFDPTAAYDNVELKWNKGPVKWDAVMAGLLPGSEGAL